MTGIFSFLPGPLFGHLHEISPLVLKMFLKHVQDPILGEESEETGLETLVFLKGNRLGIQRKY